MKCCLNCRGVRHYLFYRPPGVLPGNNFEMKAVVGQTPGYNQKSYCPVLCSARQDPGRAQSNLIIFIMSYSSYACRIELLQHKCATQPKPISHPIAGNKIIKPLLILTLI